MPSYVNHPRRPKPVHDSPQTERKWCQILLLSFGILCLIQATLNITLRLTAKSECSTTAQESQTSPAFEQEAQQCNRKRERVKALEAERNRLENNNMELNNQINEINNRNSQLTNQNQELKKQINGANDQIKELNNRNRGLNTQIIELRNKNSGLTNQINGLNNQIRELTDKNKELNDQIRMVTVPRETVTVKPACPNGWREIKSRCYFLSNERRSWDSSRIDCLSRGADLVVINNEQEQRDLYQMNGNQELLFWIGLHDVTNSGKFQWVDITPLTTSFWQVGQPGDGGPNNQENCVEMYHRNPVLSNWNDARCADLRRWVCEKEAHK